MEQTSEDWDGISDSEFLDIPLDAFYFEESHQSVRSETSTRDDTRTNSQVTFPESLHRSCGPEERSGQSTVEVDEANGLKRKGLGEGGRTRQPHFWKRRLSVTTLCEQAWCEMKLMYNFQKPHFRKQEKRRSEVQTGADIHLARELEVQDVIPISTRSREDYMAVRLLKMLQMIPLLETGVCVREFPVFGILEGVHLMGVIDELSYNQKGELVLNELKTRKENSLPGAAQTLCHNFQVGLYKLLFDAMVRGEVRREHIMDQPHRHDSLRLGEGVLAHAAKTGLRVATFGELVDALLQTLSTSTLPCIDLIQVEYLHQGSSGLIGTRVASFDETKLRAEVRGYLAYWSGQREPRGVDIEEAWKCTFCSHSENCDWRKSGYQLPDTPHTSKRFK